MAILRFIEAVAAKVAADEVKAWLPLFSQKLLSLAVARLPEEEQDRFQEEWAADLLEYPGECVRVVRALGLLFAAWKIREVDEYNITIWNGIRFTAMLIGSRPWIHHIGSFLLLSVLVFIDLHFKIKLSLYAYLSVPIACTASFFFVGAILFGTSLGCRFFWRFHDAFFGTFDKFAARYRR